MQTNLSEEFRGTQDGLRAEANLRKCVHCGFCLATCPTYQLLGDELDSPRGRIYLVKQVLEGQRPTRSTQRHFDRCLTCRNCETTCPSGVDFGALIDIGRRVVEERVQRPPPERAARWLLREGLTSSALGPAVGVGRLARPFLPQALQGKVPSAAPGNLSARSWPTREHPRKMLLLAGCVQPHLLPNVNVATARVLDAVDVQTIIAPKAGCCGAIRAHLADHEGALADMRRNIDAWWPYLQDAGHGPRAEAIVMNASGCGVTVKEYAAHLAHDPNYATKARHISQSTRDLCEIATGLLPLLQGRLQGAKAPRVALHLPCTLQHGQRLPGDLESLLRALGFDVQIARQEHHLCCGSAGTYSLLEPELARQLRDRKLAHLRALGCSTIVSANVGCIQHLQSGTNIAVRHWIELLDELLTGA